jgi:hypothetical protein
MAGNDFIVRFEGAELTDKIRSQIAGEIQAVVLREVAKLDLKGDLHAHIPRREWMGLWLRNQPLEKSGILEAKLRGGG